MLEFKASRQGSLILISLLVTAGILATVGAVTTILVREIRISKDVDNSVLSLYGTEATLERGLYDLFKLGKTPAQITGSGTYGNGVDWSLTARDKATQRVFDRIKKNSTATVNLYDTGLPNQAGGVESMTIDWTLGNDMQIDVYTWDGTTLYAPTTQTFACGGNPCQRIVINSLAVSQAYKVVMTAVNGDAFDVMIKSWTADGGGGTPINMPSPFTIEGTASIGASKQALTASLPELTPWGAAAGAGSPPPPPGPSCGNSLVEAGEQCDPPTGGVQSGQCGAQMGCSASCQCVSIAPVLTTIQVSPNPATFLWTGVQFSAQGKDQFGNNISMAAPAWSTTGGSVGTINQSGWLLVYAPNPNGILVHATSGGITGSASLSIPSPLTFTYVTHTNNCSNISSTVNLVTNTGDPGMALGNYTFNFTGPVCSYINFTDNSTVLASTVNSSGAGDPSRRFFYISEQDGYGCGSHTLQIYDRRLHAIRTGWTKTPCNDINYTYGSYDPKAIAESIAIYNQWTNTAGLSFDMVSTNENCSDITTTLNLKDNSGDPGMALGNYAVNLTGSVCAYVNFTNTSTFMSDIINKTGLGDPATRFVYISETPSAGSSNETFTVYDRQIHAMRSVFIPTPFTVINYTDWNLKVMAAQAAAYAGW